eukprot:Rhum_TRINITY_DN25803_c0_g1::Rhum_TRINITY_DN25803_c0_g1_i1::g.182813::m.182813
MFRNTARCLGRRTEFLKRLELMTDAIESKELRRRHWAKVYADTCTMAMAGGQVEGLEAIISPLPAFNRAFDVTPKIVEVVGDEDAEKFTVHYRHTARFVGPYGVVQPTGQTGTFEGINIHTVSEDGRTTHLQQSLDLLSYFMEVGAVPPMFAQEETESAAADAEAEGMGMVNLGTKQI